MVLQHIPLDALVMLRHIYGHFMVQKILSGPLCRSGEWFCLSALKSQPPPSMEGGGFKHPTHPFANLQSPPPPLWASERFVRALGQSQPFSPKRRGRDREGPSQSSTDLER